MSTSSFRARGDRDSAEAFNGPRFDSPAVSSVFSRFRSGQAAFRINCAVKVFRMYLITAEGRTPRTNDRISGFAKAFASGLAAVVSQSPFRILSEE